MTTTALVGQLDPAQLRHRGEAPTSRPGAENRCQRRTQLHRMLGAYAAHLDGLTDDEAGAEVGVGGYSQRRRASELRELGFIEWTGEERDGCMVCAITSKGLERHVRVQGGG